MDLQFDERYELRYMVKNPPPINQRETKSQLIKVLTLSSVSLEELFANRDKIRPVRGTIQDFTI